MEIIKILVVDDEARMRKLVKDFLSVKGYKVVEAADGEEAISLFMEQKDIKLILLDVMMPKMDGFETLKLIRQYSDLPVIMLTARSEERDELEGYKLGVDEYITKPFSPKILVARVEAVLRRTVGESEEKLVAGAIGYKYKEVIKEIKEIDGKKSTYVKEVIKEMPGDVGAQIFWLNGKTSKI